jgi:RNA polymerase sigma-70 factor (ECF subfamily)
MQSVTLDPPRLFLDPSTLREERRSLMRYARHLCRSHSDADDLVQEAMLRMWRHQPEFPSEGHRRAWLKRVVLNGHIDRRRRDKRARDWVSRSADDTAPVAPSAPTSTLSSAMQRNLDALSTDYRNVLLLVDVCEQSYQETAEQLACPIGTVMSRLHRARHQLRERVCCEVPMMEHGDARGGHGDRRAETASNAVAA